MLIYIYIYEKGYGEWIIYIYIFKTKWMGHICIPSCSALSMWEGYELCLYVNIYIYIWKGIENGLYIYGVRFLWMGLIFLRLKVCAYTVLNKLKTQVFTVYYNLIYTDMIYD